MDRTLDPRDNRAAYRRAVSQPEEDKDPMGNLTCGHIPDLRHICGQAGTSHSDAKIEEQDERKTFDMTEVAP